MKKFSIFLLSCFASLNAEVNVKLSKNNNVIIDQKFVDLNDFIVSSENGYTVDFGELGINEEAVVFSAKICKGQVVIAQPAVKACYNHETTFSVTEENGDILVLDINISK